MMSDFFEYQPSAMYHTFGCKLNFAETTTIESMLKARGVDTAVKGQSPDVIVVNTCSVTEVADKKCRQTIRSYHRRFPDAAICLTGCYAQLKPEEAAALPGVAIVAGNDRKTHLADLIMLWLQEHKPITEITAAKDIREFNPSCDRGSRTRFFLKVQDGCDYWCTYCTIPKARGRSRSATVAQLVEQARQAAARGGREIVITGVNIGDFGKGTGETFFDLVKALDAVEGIERYRISSIEPNLLTDEIIDYVAQSRAFMPHFHVPLQSGSDEVLKLMRRHYDTEFFRRKMEAIRECIPEAFIGVDVIVGMRGETDTEFERSLEYIASLPVSRLHVFTYSERPGTRALEIPHVVSQEEKHARTTRMIDLSNRMLTDFSMPYVSTERIALLESPRPGKPMGGFTDNYLRIATKAPLTLNNQLARVRLDSYDPATETFTATTLQD